MFNFWHFFDCGIQNLNNGLCLCEGDNHYCWLGMLMSVTISPMSWGLLEHSLSYLRAMYWELQSCLRPSCWYGPIIVPVALSPGMRVNMSPTGWVQIEDALPACELGLEMFHHFNSGWMFTYDSHNFNYGLFEIKNLISELHPCGRVTILRVFRWAYEKHNVTCVLGSAMTLSVPFKTFTQYARVAFIIFIKRRPVNSPICLSLAKRHRISAIGWFKVWDLLCHLWAGPR